MPYRCSAALLSIALASSGCSGCKDDHPYVPYTIGSATAAPFAAAPSADASPAPSSSATPGFTGEAARLAPPGTSEWRVDDVTLRAPEGSVFLSAVVADLDGDGATDAFALARSAAGGEVGALVFFRGASGVLHPTETYAPPAALAAGAGCSPLARLVRVGPHAVLAELGASCPAREPSAPSRWVAVVAAPVRPGGAFVGGVRFAATVTDPTAAPTLSLDADTADRDGDGLPDVTLRATLEGGGAPFEPGPRVSVSLAWLDRPAGLSRDAAATEASFATLSQTAALRARGAREAPGVPAFVAQTRALYRAVCSDGGHPRLLGVTGAGTIACGAARALEELGLAETKAYATLGDPLRASLALERAQRSPASRTQARTSDAAGWIAAVAPVSTARSVRAVAAVPARDTGRPSWGPLAFEGTGKLLVRTRAGVVRVDPDLGDETDADGVLPWPLAVAAPDGIMRWTEVYDPCDGVALHATLYSGDDARDVPLPVAPLLGSRCAGNKGAPVRLVPIAWSQAGLEAFVDGEPVLVATDGSRAAPIASFLDVPGPSGSPRSIDGKALVVPGPAGLLVKSGGHARLLRAPELEGTYGEQGGCTVSADGTHVACVRSGKAWVGAWDP